MDQLFGSQQFAMMKVALTAIRQIFLILLRWFHCISTFYIPLQYQKWKQNVHDFFHPSCTWSLFKHLLIYSILKTFIFFKTSFCLRPLFSCLLAQSWFWCFWGVFKTGCSVYSSTTSNVFSIRHEAFQALVQSHYSRIGLNLVFFHTEWSPIFFPEQSLCLCFGF